jgi:hypothetical protein
MGSRAWHLSLALTVSLVFCLALLSRFRSHSNVGLEPATLDVELELHFGLSVGPIQFGKYSISGFGWRPHERPYVQKVEFSEGGLKVNEIYFGNSDSQSPRRGRWSQAEVVRLRELYGLRDDAAIARELNRPVSSIRKMADKIFPLSAKSGPWSAAEVLNLKRYLGATTPEIIARVMGRDLSEVRSQILELGSIVSEDGLSREQVTEFKRIYGRRTDDDLAMIFSSSPEEIQRLAKEYALAKDKAFVRKRKGDSATRMPRWTQAELEFLKREYLVQPNIQLALHLDRSVKSVVSKAHNLGLKKSSQRLREMGRQNVSLRYQQEHDEIVPATPLHPPTTPDLDSLTPLPKNEQSIQPTPKSSPHPIDD